jgi:hypothetical protein
MIKFLAERNGRLMIGLGLSRENCRKLLEGKPIFIDLKVMMMDVKEVPNLSDGTILIFGGKDEKTMQDDFKKHGVELPNPRPHYDEN